MEFMDIWKFQERLSAALMGWAAASIAFGLALVRRDSPFHKGMGEQLAGWGVINGLIAIFGGIGATRRRRQPDAELIATQAAEKRKLSRLLWINSGLDFFYVLGGVLATRTRGAADERWRGRGVGIIIQGAFLFFFDLINVLLLRRLRANVEI